MKIEELIQQHEDTILRIKTRLYFLIALEDELQSITRRKTFKIKNDISYRTIVDTWDMLVIDLASLGRGMLGSGGFFNQFKANLGEVKPAKKKEIEAPKGSIQYVGNPVSEEDLDRVRLELDKHFVETVYKAQQEQLFKLFPKLKDRQPRKINHQDVDDLKDRFDAIVGDIVSDRDTNRAHKFENLNNKTIQPKLDFKILAKKFEEIEEMLNGLRNISTQSTFAYSDMNFANKKETAKDLVNSVLWGTNKMEDVFTGLNKELSSPHLGRQLYGWMIRDRFIEQIHVEHDRIVAEIKANPKDPRNQNIEDFCFNDVHIEENQKWSSLPSLKEDWKMALGLIRRSYLRIRYWK
jgi:hypothetical protein